jgi:hypothetical protein
VQEIIFFVWGKTYVHNRAFLGIFDPKIAFSYAQEILRIKKISHTFRISDTWIVNIFLMLTLFVSFMLSFLVVKCIFCITQLDNANPDLCWELQSKKCCISHWEISHGYFLVQCPWSYIRMHTEELAPRVLRSPLGNAQTTLETLWEEANFSTQSTRPFGHFPKSERTPEGAQDPRLSLIPQCIVA